MLDNPILVSLSQAKGNRDGKSHQNKDIMSKEIDYVLVDPIRYVPTITILDCERPYASGRDKRRERRRREREGRKDK